MNKKEFNSSIEENFYLSQEWPVILPEIFAPNIVSIDGRFERAISFPPDVEELYYATREDGNWSVNFSRLENKKWTDLKKQILQKLSVVLQRSHL